MSELIGALFLGVILVLISLLMIKVGWSLFMIPVFHLVDITWMQALGLSLLASVFRSSGVSASKKG